MDNGGRGVFFLLFCFCGGFLTFAKRRLDIIRKMGAVVVVKLVQACLHGCSDASPVTSCSYFILGARPTDPSSSSPSSPFKDKEVLVDHPYPRRLVELREYPDRLVVVGKEEVLRRPYLGHRQH